MRTGWICAGLRGANGRRCLEALPRPMNDPSPMLEPAQAVIAARSEQQAMDWSLVLSSQGIGSTIQRSEEGGWRIEVDPPD